MHFSSPPRKRLSAGLTGLVGIPGLIRLTMSPPISAGGTGTPQDPRCRFCDRGNSAFRHSSSFHRQLHLSPARIWTEGFAATMLGGWQLNGILAIPDRIAIHPTLQTSTTNGTASRPDRVGSGLLSKWPVDPALVRPDGITTPALYTYGNAGRGHPVRARPHGSIFPSKEALRHHEGDAGRSSRHASPPPRGSGVSPIPHRPETRGASCCRCRTGRTEGWPDTGSPAGRPLRSPAVTHDRLGSCAVRAASAFAALADVNRVIFCTESAELPGSWRRYLTGLRLPWAHVASSVRSGRSPMCSIPNHPRLSSRRNYHPGATPASRPARPTDGRAAADHLDLAGNPGGHLLPRGAGASGTRGARVSGVSETGAFGCGCSSNAGAVGLLERRERFRRCAECRASAASLTASAERWLSGAVRSCPVRRAFASVDSDTGDAERDHGRESPHRARRRGAAGQHDSVGRIARASCSGRAASSTAAMVKSPGSSSSRPRSALASMSSRTTSFISRPSSPSPSTCAAPALI